MSQPFEEGATPPTGPAEGPAPIETTGVPAGAPVDPVTEANPLLRLADDGGPALEEEPTPPVAPSAPSMTPGVPSFSMSTVPKEPNPIEVFEGEGGPPAPAEDHKGPTGPDTGMSQAAA